MRGKPSVDSFLAGSNKPKAARTKSKKRVGRVAKQAALPIDPDKRTKKLFELPESLVIAIERRCTEERAKHGKRVTQREVVEALLHKWVSGDVAI